MDDDEFVGPPDPGQRGQLGVVIEGPSDPQSFVGPLFVDGPQHRFRTRPFPTISPDIDALDYEQVRAANALHYRSHWFTIMENQPPAGAYVPPYRDVTQAMAPVPRPNVHLDDWSDEAFGLYGDSQPNPLAVRPQPPTHSLSATPMFPPFHATLPGPVENLRLGPVSPGLSDTAFAGHGGGISILPLGMESGQRSVRTPRSRKRTRR